MSKFTGDLVEIGVAKESTRGTAVAPTYGLKWSDLKMNNKALTSLDASRSGILEDSRSLNVVGTYAEGDLSGPVRDRSIGLLFLSLFGSVTDAVVGGESIVYSHTYSVQQGVNHQSLTFHRKDANGGKDFPLGMVGGIDLTVEPEKHLMMAAKIRAKSAASATIGTFTVTIASPGVVTLNSHGLATGDAVIPTTTDTLPTGITAGTTYYVIKNDSNSFWLATSLANALAATKINTSGSQAGTHTMSLSSRYIAYASEYTFLPQHCTFKIAADQASLGAANATNIRSIKLSIEQNVEDDRSLGSTAQTDIVNKELMITCEVQIVRSADTYVTALLAGTNYAIRFDATNSDVTLGTASNPQVRVDLHQVTLESADTDESAGNLAVQTLVFKATYSETDSAMVTPSVTNLVAAY